MALRSTPWQSAASVVALLLSLAACGRKHEAVFHPDGDAYVSDLSVPHEDQLSQALYVDQAVLQTRLALSDLKGQGGPPPASRFVRLRFTEPEPDRLGHPRTERLFTLTFDVSDLRRAQLSRLEDAKLLDLAKSDPEGDQGAGAIGLWCLVYRADAPLFCS